MIAVIFELRPADGQRQAYLDLAAALRDAIETIPGFVSIERFQSLADPEKLLSLSIFESEAAVRAWRNGEAHRAAQCAGRAFILGGYRLRVAEVVRDYGMAARDEAPDDSRAIHG